MQDRTGSSNRQTAAEPRRPSPPLAPRPPRRRLTLNEIVYLVARAVLGLVFVLVFVTGEIALIPAVFRPALFVAFALSTTTTIGVLVATVGLRKPAEWVLRVAAIPDLVAIALAVYASQAIGDPAFVWVIGFAIVNALILPIGESLVMTAAVAIVHLGAYIYATRSGAAAVPWATEVSKSVGVIVLGYFAADAVRRQTTREAEIVARQEAIAGLNAQLQRRLEDLTAVYEIAELIHSSLDFESTGTQLVDRICHLLELPGCGLTVRDKQRDITLFTATSGGFQFQRWGDPARQDCLVGADPEDACIALHENERVTVVFCSREENLERMGLEDKLVLQTLAGELAVAMDKARLYSLTKRLSITDELTGLYNFRHMHDRLHEEVERARRYDGTASLLMMDVDHFKQLNDREGHVAGDRALADLGALLVSCVRQTDVAARYGGEEFAVILPETDVEQAQIVADKVLDAVSRHAFLDATGVARVRLTVSIGVATFPAHAGQESELVRRADTALYEAKRLGRARVHVASVLGEAESLS